MSGHRSRIAWSTILRACGHATAKPMMLRVSANTFIAIWSRRATPSSARSVLTAAQIRWPCSSRSWGVDGAEFDDAELVQVFGVFAFSVRRCWPRRGVPEFPPRLVGAERGDSGADLMVGLLAVVEQEFVVEKDHRVERQDRSFAA
jgi:hypothetical protein